MSIPYPDITITIEDAYPDTLQGWWVIPVTCVIHSPQFRDSESSTDIVVEAIDEKDAYREAMMRLRIEVISKDGKTKTFIVTEYFDDLILREYE